MSLKSLLPASGNSIDSPITVRDETIAWEAGPLAVGTRTGRGAARPKPQEPAAARSSPQPAALVCVTGLQAHVYTFLLWGGSSRAQSTVQVPSKYRPSTVQVPSKYRPGTVQVPSRYRPGTVQVPSTYRPRTVHVPSTYRPRPRTCVLNLETCPARCVGRDPGRPGIIPARPGTIQVPPRDHPSTAQVPSKYRPSTVQVSVADEDRRDRDEVAYDDVEALQHGLRGGRVRQEHPCRVRLEQAVLKV
eukprot:gene11625-biopygen8544